MKELNTKLQAQFDKMCATGKLFRVSLSGNIIWEIYLSSFEIDPIFRAPDSTTHNCNLCNNFIRRYGNVVAIDENFNPMSIFDIEIEGEFAPVVEKLSFRIRQSEIVSVFFESEKELAILSYEPQVKNREVYRLGMAKNVKRYTQAEADLYPGTVKANEVLTFNHLHLDLPTRYVLKGNNSIESVNAEFTSSKDVFTRAMTEIPLDTLTLVRDLIIQGSLLNGDAHLHKVERMIELTIEYNSYSNTFVNLNNWCWATSYNLPIAKFRNELIGTLCVELAEGVELNKACQTWNKRVDPANYMKVASPITQRQIDEAMKFTVENGYVESFNRRMATIDDINVSEILHSNVGVGEIKNVTIFDKLKPTASTRHKRSEFDGVEEIHIDKFMSEILPNCSSVEVFLTNNHENYMVNLTTPINKESKPIFKWDNNYSWTFNGNLTGKSEIKEAVKLAGGNVEGVLNFRLAWNDTGVRDDSDLDAWVQEPSGMKIGFSTPFRKDRDNTRSPYSGQLDVDNTSPNGKLAVENITWTDKSKMENGVYKFWVNQYSPRNSQGFKVEIEFDEETYLYSYNLPISHSSNVQVAEVTVINGNFTIKHILPEIGNSSKEIYNLETNKFHKVNLVCLSPNHWGNNSVGNKHFLFMIDGCKNNNSIRTFHNENLLPELLNQHRKVMDVLGNQSSIKNDGNQLAGIGFNSTVRDELIVRLAGSHKRVVKIKF
jgi:hypothetical protein